MTNEINADIVVLGAGIVGTCCALSLLERGHPVTLIDRQQPGEAASFGNAGVVSPWSCVPQCLPGIWKNVPGWLLRKDGPVSFHWRQVPALLPWMLRFFANGTEAKVNEIADVMDRLMAGNIEAYRHHLRGTENQHLLKDSWYVNVYRGAAKPDLKDLPWKLRLDRGAPVEIIGGQDLFELEPALSRDCHSAVIIKDQARALHPGDLTKALAGKAQRLGAKFIQAEARQLRPDRKGGYQLEAQGQTIACNRLVLAGGIWSADLLKCLGIKLPMIAERGYHAEFRNPGVTLNNSVMDVAGKFVISSMTNGIRVAGTSEFAHRDAPPNHERSAILERQARSLLPDLTSEKADHWMGVRPSLPDNLPLIGPLPGHPNLIAAFGHSHYGMGMAPATGRIVAGLISGDRDNQHLGAISPARMV